MQMNLGGLPRILFKPVISTSSSSSVREDSSRIYVAVGYGFFVEMTHDEALRFIDKKTSQLTASVHINCSSSVVLFLQQLRKKTALTLVHVFEISARLYAKAL